VTDDENEEGVDYSATTGTLPFKNSAVVIDKSEKYSEDLQTVLDSLNRNSGEKLLGNKKDPEKMDTTETLQSVKVNGDIPPYNSPLGEDERSPKPTTAEPFFKSIGFKPPSFIRHLASKKSKTSHASTENVIREENQDIKLAKSVRRLSQSLPDVQHQHT
jgi:hypothetical protein